jgi:xanthine dehydrogenase accessory factor
MNEIQAIIDAFNSLKAAGNRCALATVVSVSGSAYRRPGARMLISDTGQTHGGISGGCLDRDVIRAAREVMQNNQPILRAYDSTEDGDFAPSMGCAGVIQILIQPLSAADPGPIPLLTRVHASHAPAIYSTVYKSTVASVSIGQSVTESLAAQLDGFSDDCALALRSDLSIEKSYKLATGEIFVFIEVLRPPQPLVIFGEGSDVLPLLNFAKSLGWHVTVVPAASSAGRFTAADVVLPATIEFPAGNVAVDARTAAVVMTHSYPRDLELLETLIKSPARYIGVLGPKRRTEKLLATLQAHEMPSVSFARIHAPVGLDIGAETPSEIALAVLAEIQSVLKDRPGTSLRDRKAPIHSAGFSPAPTKPFPITSCPASEL